MDPEQEQQLGMFTQSFSALFCFFQRPDDTARFRDAEVQHRLGRVLVFVSALRSQHPDRDSSLSFIYDISQQTRASLSVGLSVRIFVRLFVPLFLCFLQYSRRDSGFFISYIYTLLAAGTHPLLRQVVAMESVASNNTHAVIKNCPVFAGRDKESFQECKSKLRVCLSFYSKAVLEVFQGKTQPSSWIPGSADTATLNAVAEHKRSQANQDLWTVQLLTTSGSANDAVRKFEGNRPEDGAGHGQLAWKTLTEKYSETRRACHEKLVNTEMEPGQDPNDLFSFWTNDATSLRK